MKDHPYKRFCDSELILRDELAIDRTMLSNERTLLAYLRSALTLIIAGTTFLHFVEQGALYYVGIISIPFGFAVGVLGVIRYKKMHAGIRIVRKKMGE